MVTSISLHVAIIIQLSYCLSALHLNRSLSATSLKIFSSFFFVPSFVSIQELIYPIPSYSFLFLPSYTSLPYREKRIELDIKDLVGVLWACTRVHVSTLKIRFFSCDEWIIKKNSRRHRINITEHDRMTRHK